MKITPSIIINIPAALGCQVFFGILLFLGQFHDGDSSAPLPVAARAV
jgi:hypothetical protein